MADLDVVAVIQAKPGHEDTVRGALKQLAASSLEEEGCLGYDIKVAQDQPGVFIAVERWRGPEDLAAHMLTAHLGAALESAGPFLVAPPAVYPLVDA